MPYEMSDITVAGEKVLRVEGRGPLTGADAAKVMDRVMPDLNLAYDSLISILRSDSSLSGDARKTFAERSREYQKKHGRPADQIVSNVIESSFLRIIAAFVIKASTHDAPTAFFKTEPEALSWLDAQIKLRQAAKK